MPQNNIFSNLDLFSALGNLASNKDNSPNSNFNSNISSNNNKNDLYAHNEINSKKFIPKVEPITSTFSVKDIVNYGTVFETDRLNIIDINLKNNKMIELTIDPEDDALQVLRLDNMRYIIDNWKITSSEMKNDSMDIVLNKIFEDYPVSINDIDLGEISYNVIFDKDHLTLAPASNDTPNIANILQMFIGSLHNGNMSKMIDGLGPITF